MSRIAYADASALVKLVLNETESPAVFHWFTQAPRFATSRMGVIEVHRATARRPHDPAHRDRVVDEVEVIEVNEAIARVAAMLQPQVLRTLDAIHLATALALVPDLDAFVTYDDRLADAARVLGLPVVRPA